MAPLLTRTHLERTHILKEILSHIDDYAAEYDAIDVPTLKDEVLKPVIAETFNPEVQIRGFLRTFRHTSAYKTALARISSTDLKRQINEFVEGKDAKDVVKGSTFREDHHRSPPVEQHFSLLRELKRLFVCGVEVKKAVEDVKHPKHGHVRDLPVIYEGKEDDKVIECYSAVPFSNWGQTVHNVPRYTFLPTTVCGVQRIVQYAIANNYRVRCAGYRHSWSPIFSQDKELFISFVNLETVNTLPDPTSLIPGEYNADTAWELKSIELKEETVSGKKRLCRVGAAVTNEEFRRWAIEGNAWSLPADVILVEVTIGGVNGPICHGAGISHKTLSDYVRRIEYVDCNGQLQTVDNSEHIKAAAGAFGLLGVVTHITFELDAMTYAVIQPLKQDVGLAVPPLDKRDIPEALRSEWFDTHDADELVSFATKEFNQRAANDYYSEWFWFPYQKKVWTNTFNTTTDSSDVKDYPSDSGVFLQWVQNWLGGVVTTNPFFNAIPGYWQAQLMATLAMASMPPTFGEDETPTYKTFLPDALHFRRGIQNMRVRDIELQIPLPPRADDPTKPDFSIVQRAWWDVIKLVYKDADTGSDPSSAMRVALEMRLMAGSDMLMAPQKGNDLGTLSIEVLTLPDAVADEEWHDFAQRVIDVWMSYGGNVRPHWAKEWDGFKFKGQHAREYLKEVAYKDQISEFRETLRRIGEGQGWGLAQLQKRFSNELWDHLVYA